MKEKENVGKGKFGTKMGRRNIGTAQLITDRVALLVENQAYNLDFLA